VNDVFTCIRSVQVARRATMLARRTIPLNQTRWPPLTPAGMRARTAWLLIARPLPRAEKAWAMNASMSRSKPAQVLTPCSAAFWFRRRHGCASNIRQLTDVYVCNLQ
jgi:hypothetical protein